jgi:hypothetical protein
VAKVNLNEFAKSIALEEGKKKSLNIAQIKEVLKIVGQRIARMGMDERNTLIDKLIMKYRV